MQSCIAEIASRMSSNSMSGKVSEMSGGLFGIASRTGTLLLATCQLKWRWRLWAIGRDMLLPRRLVRSRSLSRETSPSPVPVLKWLSNESTVRLLPKAGCSVLSTVAFDMLLRKRLMRSRNLSRETSLGVVPVLRRLSTMSLLPKVGC
jgi:hypothetical protein